MDVALIDSHAHLNDGRFRHDLNEVLQHAKTTGVSTIINVGYDLDSSEKAIKLAKREPIVYGAVGIHPHDAVKAPSDYPEKVRKLASREKVVAIGEIGLDFYYNHSPAEVQKEVFRGQLRLAKELKLPVIIHDREAHLEVLEILREEDTGLAGGVFHCFSGDKAFAKKCLDLGFYISLAGPVTFNKAVNLAEVARFIPLDRLLLETDSPYLAPVPHRGKRNEPAYVAYIAEQVAKLRGEDLSVIAAAASKNAQILFNLV